MNHITFVILGSLGTLGHIRLAFDICRLVGQETGRRRVSIITEKCDIPEHIDSMFEDVLFVEPVEQIPSRGGHLIADYATDEIKRHFKYVEGSIFVFSTFFSTSLSQLAHKYGRYVIWMSYPLRDSYLELFKLDNYQELFDEIVLLEDIPQENVSSYNDFKTTCTFLPATTYALNAHNYPLENHKIASILVMSGGGGLPGTTQFISGVIKATAGLERNVRILPGLFMQNAGLVTTERYINMNTIHESLGPTKLVISQAGYHTVHELLATSTPCILVPGSRSIDNQELRAASLARQVGSIIRLPQELQDIRTDIEACLGRQEWLIDVIGKMENLKTQRRWNRLDSYARWAGAIRRWVTI